MPRSRRYLTLGDSRLSNLDVYDFDEEIFRSRLVGDPTWTPDLIKYTSTLQDPFDDNNFSPNWTIGQIVSGGWNGSGWTIEEIRNRVEITAAAGVSGNGGGVVTVDSDYTLDKIFIALPNVGSIQFGEAIRLSFGSLSGGYSLVAHSDGTLELESIGVGTLGTGTRNSEIRVQLRYDETTDQVKVDTAPATNDPPLSGDWTNRISVARGSLPLKGKIGLSVGAYSSVATPTVVQFDGLNMATSAAFLYKGAALRSSAYKGALLDSQIYKGSAFSRIFAA